MVVSGSVVSSISFLAESRRCACATAIGVAPRCCQNKRRRCRAPIPSRSANASTLESSSSPSKRSLVDQPQSTRHRGGSSIPSRGAPALGTAPQAGPKTRLKSGRGRRIIVDVFFLGRARRAHRPAENPRGPHRDEELPIEARVARQTSRPADFAIQFHKSLPRS